MSAPPPYATRHCFRHPDREAGVRCVRCDRPICPDCMIPASVGFQCPECVREGSRSVRRPVTRYGGLAVRGAPVTYSLVAINVAIFVVTSASGGARNLLGGGTGSLYEKFALVPPAVAHGEWWRLLASAFLHYGVVHILVNMMALVLIGPAVEGAFGRWRYLALYLLSGIGGSLLTVAIASPATQAAGASGAIFGLFGALYLLQRRVGQREGTILPTIVINLVLSFTIPNISWEGHVGGLITGAAITAALTATARQAAGRARRHGAVLALVSLIMAGLGFAAVHHERSVCASSQDQNVLGFCEVYDPTSVEPPGTNSGPGNAALTRNVVLSIEIARDSGGRHA